MSGSTEVYMCFVFQRDDHNSCRGVRKFTCVLCFRETIITHVGEYGSLHVFCVSERRSSLMSGSTEVYICFVFQRDDHHSCRGVRKLTYVLCFRETIITHVGEYGRLGRITVGYDSTGPESLWYLERARHDSISRHNLEALKHGGDINGIELGNCLK